jgi:hypothetical protein
MCVVRGPKKSSTYSREYASGFSGPAALHLAAPPSSRHEGNVGQAPNDHALPTLRNLDGRGILPPP